MKDIKLYPTEELITELLDRFDSSIFAGVQHKTKKQDDHTFRWKGSITTIRGLDEIMHDYLIGDTERIMCEDT